MPWKDNTSGPWGGGPERFGSGPQRPSGPPQPDLDDLLDNLRDRFRGRGSGKNARGGGSGGGRRPSWVVVLAMLGVVLVVWIYASMFRVQPDEAAVVLTFGKFTTIQGPGLHFAAWPVQRAEVLPVTREISIAIGYEGSADTDPASVRIRNPGIKESLMLTGDENIVDINFQVVWNIAEPDKFLFNLAEPSMTIKAVAESAMRQVIGRSELKPILNRDRASVTLDVRELIQETLDSYESGVNIVRVNFDRADPPPAVIDAFRDVQAAEQDRDTLEKRAGAYANQRLAEARGQSAQILQEAEAYRAQVVKEAEGEAQRFIAVYASYEVAPEVTRKRLYLETIEQVFSNVEKIIIDKAGTSGQGVVPYLPLDQLRKGRSSASEGDQQ